MWGQIKHAINNNLDKPLNMQGFTTTGYTLRHGGPSPDTILHTELSVKGSGFLTGASFRGGFPAGGGRVRIFVNGEEVITHEQTGTGNFHLFQDIGANGTPFGYAIRTTAISNSVMLNAPIFFSDSLRIEIESHTLNPSNNFLLSDIYLGLFDGAQVESAEHGTSFRRMDFTADTTFTITESVRDNTMRVWAIGQGGDERAPWHLGTGWQVWTGPGGVGQHIIDAPHDLQQGDNINVVIGATGNDGRTIISRNNSAIFTLNRGANGTTGGPISPGSSEQPGNLTPQSSPAPFGTRGRGASGRHFVPHVPLPVPQATRGNPGMVRIEYETI